MSSSGSELGHCQKIDNFFEFLIIESFCIANCCVTEVKMYTLIFFNSATFNIEFSGKPLIFY